MANPVLDGFRRLDVLARFSAVADWLRAVRGWRRLLVAAGLGAVSALAYAPFYLWPIFFLTFPALVVLIDGTSGARRAWRDAALIGWAFGTGCFFVGLHWVGFAFVVDAERHAWLLPFVAVLFPGGLGLFFAAAAGLARLAWANGVGRIAMLAATLSAMEWLRGHVLTGFPWNLPGYVWSGFDVMFQTASIWGIYGLSLITLVAVLLPAAIVSADGRRGARWPLGASAAILLVLFAFGWVRLPSGSAPNVENVALRIVQTNVPQGEKWKPELLARNWKLLIDLTRRPGLETRTHVIWPEAAPPFFLLQEPAGLQVISEILPDTTTLLTGVVRVEQDGDTRRFFNSMAAITGDGRIVGVYDKAHLVPFGEYLPLYQVLEPLGITKITGGTGGYSQGRGVTTMTIPGTPSFGPLICYEVIFPGAVVEPGKRPRWLVTMTDDSWFGPWTGPYQHLGIAKVRAAEEGLPIVRAASTGVSAVIDPFGRVVASLGLDQMGIVDAALPGEIASTIYTFVGDAIFALMLIVLTVAGLFFYRSAK